MSFNDSMNAAKIRAACEEKAAQENRSIGQDACTAQGQAKAPETTVRELLDIRIKRSEVSREFHVRAALDAEAGIAALMGLKASLCGSFLDSGASRVTALGWKL